MSVDLTRRIARPLSRLLFTPEWMWHTRGSKPEFFPDFLGIGVPKAGTTWLHNNLIKHPDLFLPEKKESHFFDLRWHKPIGAYLSEFADATGATKGEITPSYCTLPASRIRWIHRFNPQLRLILMLRNPAEQAWSYLLMKEYWRAPDPRAALELQPDQLIDFVQSERVRSRTEHARIARGWLSVFPREQLFVGRFERLSSEPERLLSEVFGHLGVSVPTDWSPFPTRLKFWQGKGPRLPDNLRSVLTEFYAGSIHQTEELLEIDLGDWLI